MPFITNTINHAVYFCTPDTHSAKRHLLGKSNQRSIGLISAVNGMSVHLLYRYFFDE